MPCENAFRAPKKSAKLGKLKAVHNEIWASLKNRRAVKDTSPAEKATTPYPKYKSKWESAYAQYLNALLFAGEIQSWQYECVTLRILGNSMNKFTPDFCVVIAHPDGHTSTQFHEVKGRTREAFAVKWKCAKDQFPHHKFILIKLVRGQWEAS